jgi:hypothetical protein
VKEHKGEKAAANGNQKLHTIKLLSIGNLTKTTVLITGAMEDKVVNPVLATHHSVEAVVGERTSPGPNDPVPPST